LASRSEIEIEQLRAKKNVYLLDVRNVEHREQRSEPNACPGFFRRFAFRALRSALADLHEARRQRPLAVARLDGALAKKNSFAPDRYRPDDRPRIHVVNLAALIAAVALAIVAGWDPTQHRRTANRAKARISRKHV